MHLFGIVGLVLNAAATVLLMWFPPTVAEYTEDGTWVPGGGTFSELPASPEQRRLWQRRFKVRRWSFRGAMGLLFFGFALQLIDLICA